MGKWGNVSRTPNALGGVMQVGDLVTISYEQDRIGIILTIDESKTFGYHVRWLKDGKSFKKHARLTGDFGNYSRGVLLELDKK